MHRENQWMEGKMSPLKGKSRNELHTIIRQQQAEIDALRRRVEILEATDVGSLKQEVRLLEDQNAKSQEQIRDLQVAAVMTQGLTMFTSVGALALLGEKVLDVLEKAPTFIKEEEREELREKLGEFATRLVSAVVEIDGLSRAAWARQRRVLEVRASTLPPLKRALFHALDQLARPSRFGSKLYVLLLEVLELDQKLEADQQEILGLLSTMLDTLSNLWPLAAVNSLVPLLRYVGYDEAAEAAGEILHSLDQGHCIPQHLVRRIRYDLVTMGAVQEGTKPTTIIQYLADGHMLRRSGCSPDAAYAQGLIAGSPSHLKRASRAYAGLMTIFDRVCNFPSNEDLELLEGFAGIFQETIDRINQQQTAAQVSSEGSYY